MDCFTALFIFPPFNITSIKYYLFLLCVHSVHSSGIIYWDWVIVQLSTNKVDSVLKRRGAWRGAYLGPGSAGHSVQCRWGFGKWFEKSFPLISRNNLSPAQLTQQLPQPQQPTSDFVFKAFLHMETVHWCLAHTYFKFRRHKWGMRMVNGNNKLLLLLFKRLIVRLLPWGLCPRAWESPPVSHLLHHSSPTMGCCKWKWKVESNM